MPTKPTPTPDAATLAQCQRLGATWLRYHGQHWALRDTPIWELYRHNGDQLQRRLLGYPGGDWRGYDGTLPLDVTRVENKDEVSE